MVGEDRVEHAPRFGLAVGRGLSLDLGGKRISRPRVRRVELGGAPQVGDRFGEAAPRALELAEEPVDARGALALLGRELPRPLEPLGREVEL